MIWSITFDIPQRALTGNKLSPLPISRRHWPRREKIDWGFHFYYKNLEEWSEDLFLQFIAVVNAFALIFAFNFLRDCSFNSKIIYFPFHQLGMEQFGRRTAPLTKFRNYGESSPVPLLCRPPHRASDLKRPLLLNQCWSRRHLPEVTVTSTCRWHHFRPMITPIRTAFLTPPTRSCRRSRTNWPVSWGRKNQTRRCGRETKMAGEPPASLLGRIRPLASYMAFGGWLGLWKQQRRVESLCLFAELAAASSFFCSPCCFSLWQRPSMQTMLSATSLLFYARLWRCAFKRTLAFFQKIVLLYFFACTCDERTFSILL